MFGTARYALLALGAIVIHCTIDPEDFSFHAGPRNQTPGGAIILKENMDWKSNLIETREQIRALLAETKRIAVLGMERDEKSERPAYYVPQYMMDAGFEIIPVPVKYPGLDRVAGLQAYPSVSGVPGEIDMVNVFRRAQDIPPHVPDILAKRPKSVWFQLGIRNDAAAETLARAGIKVVQDLCLMVEHRRSR